MERNHKVIDLLIDRRVTVETHVNAPLEVIVRLLTHTKSLRYIRDQDTGDIYIFDAFAVTHDQVARAIAFTLGRGRRRLLIHNAGWIMVEGEDKPTVIDKMGHSHPMNHVLPLVIISG